MFHRIHQAARAHYQKRYASVYAHAKQLFIFDLILLCFAIILLATGIFLFLWKPTVADQIKLTLSLGSARIQSGDEVHLKINYANDSKSILENPILALKLPAGFIVDRSSTPENVFSDVSTFSLPALPPGAEGQADVTGEFWSQPGATDNIIATLSYNQKGNSRTEQAYGSFLARLPESILQGSLSVASNTFPNEPLPWTYTLVNTANHPVNNIRIVAEPQNTVKILSGQIEGLTLASGAKETITGTITASTDAVSLPLTVTPHILANSQDIPQIGTEKNINVFAPHASVTVSYQNPPTFVEPGTSTTASVQWKNDGNLEFKNALLTLTPTPGILDLAATAKANQITTSGNSLLIKQNNRTALTDALPGTADSFNLTLIFLPKFTAADVSDFTLTPSLTANLPNVLGQSFTLSGVAASLPLPTELYLTAQTRYYTPDGDQLGRGPLPPMVGSQTTYWIFVRITNGIHAVDNVHFQTTLPAGVSFTGRQSVTIGQPLSYDASNHTVNWNIDSLPADSQTGLYFEVAVVPSANQVGKTLTLTEPLNLSATDSAVEKQFSLTAAALMNLLANNDSGSTQGAAVVE